MAEWQIVISLDRDHAQPVYRRIASAIAHDIARGRLAPGARLPGTRSLAGMLGLSRHTVGAAYDALIAEGWLTSTEASGTFVSASMPEPSLRSQLARGSPHGAARQPGAAVSSSPLSGPRRPGIRELDLSSGQPDLVTLPTDEVARAFRRALKLSCQDSLGYGHPGGNVRLRRALAHMVSATREVRAEVDNVVVTGGSQMAFTLLACTLLGPGDTVAVEELGYRAAWSALQRTGASLQPVRIDDEGLVVDDLRALDASSSVTAVYVTPHRQYPTTVTMSASRRLQLLDLAREREIVIIEDDYDHEFNYSNRPVPPLASLDSFGTVIYVGTLSKVFAPGLRLGFVIAPPDTVDALIAQRASLDLHGSQLVEVATAILFEDGTIQRHVNRVRRLYADRRDHMVAELKSCLRSVVRVAASDGGLGLWCTVDDQVDVEEWAARAAARNVGVHTGQHYSFRRHAVPALRLSFAPLTPEQITRGVSTLRQTLPLRRTD